MKALSLSLSLSLSLMSTEQAEGSLVEHEELLHSPTGCNSVVSANPPLSVPLNHHKKLYNLEHRK